MTDILIKNFIEITIDSYAVVKNNRDLVYAFTQFPPKVTFYTTIAQNHNQDIDIDTICPSDSDFPSFTCVCVYSVLYNFIACFSTATCNSSIFTMVP